MLFTVFITNTMMRCERNRSKNPISVKYIKKNIISFAFLRLEKYIYIKKTKIISIKIDMRKLSYTSFIF